MEVLILGDAIKSLVQAAILSGFGLSFGAITYALLVYPSMRRPEYRSPRGCPKRPAATVGVMIALAFAIGSYFSFLDSFFRIDLSPSQASLIYYYPLHSVTLLRNQIDRLDRRIEITKSGRRIRLIVATQDGKTFESGELKPEDFENTYQRLEQWFMNG